MLKQEGIEVVLHYLDDFLLVGAPNSSECERALSILLRVFGELGLPVATNKSEGPATQLTFWHSSWTLCSWSFVFLLRR